MVYRWYEVSSNDKNTVVILIVCSNLTLQNLCSISECIYRKCLGCHFFSSSKWTSRYSVTSWLWDKYTVNGKQCQGQCQGCFRSVVVITCASHAQGRQFMPGRKHIFWPARRPDTEIKCIVIIIIIIIMNFFIVSWFGVSWSPKY